MKANYHTHTARCNHASGTDEAYVQAALDAGFETLGFSDHAPWAFASGYVSGIRMGMDELPGYIQSIRGLQRKYADRLPIHLGLEAEYYPRYHDHLLRLREMGISYLILGQHQVDSEEDAPATCIDRRTEDGIRRYAEAVVRGIRTGLFACVAHPDLIMTQPDVPLTPAGEDAADMICQAAKEQGIPIEYNLLGVLSQLEGERRGYPSRPFWERVRRHGNTVILGVDAHSPQQLRDPRTWNLATEQVRALGLPLTDHILIPS